MTRDLSCFKAYDIRGQVPRDIDTDLACALGRAVVELLPASSVVLGRDARLSGPELHDALAQGLLEAGATVSSLGVCGTEEIYHAAAQHGFDAGIMITGSHNPADENGFKLVRGGAIPISGDSGLRELQQRVGVLLAGEMPVAAPSGRAVEQVSFRQEYTRWLLDYSGIRNLSGKGRPFRIVADAGNGCAGLVLRELLPHLPCEVICLNMEPDGHFPLGVPNPLLPERREATARAVREHKADLGLAWDGDFDRCFFYDHEGNFIEGYYLVGLLASEILRACPGGRVVHDTRVYWNTRQMVAEAGGVAVMGKTGHAFMKERMRTENAVYGGEMSAHHYFRDFAYCDSGMLPWLLMLACLARNEATLAELVHDRMAAWPCSGELNRRVADAPTLMQKIRDRYAPDALHEDRIDGINLEFANWRFNLRMSNTEPLLRLNVESRGDRALLEDKTAELLALLDADGAEQA